MGLLDNLKEGATGVKDKAADLAQSGISKSRQLIEIAKLRTDNLGERDTIKKAYLELGKLYYAEMGASPEGAFIAACERITAANAAIEANNERIAELKADSGLDEAAEKAKEAAEKAKEAAAGAAEKARDMASEAMDKVKDAVSGEVEDVTDAEVEVEAAEPEVKTEEELQAAEEVKEAIQEAVEQIEAVKEETAKVEQEVEQLQKDMEEKTPETEEEDK